MGLQGVIVSQTSDQRLEAKGEQGPKEPTHTLDKRETNISEKSIHVKL